MEDFEAWYFVEHQRVLGACVVVAGEVEVAREATDEAFARALERWSAVTTMMAPGAWVQVVALNHLRRLLRRRRVERRLLVGFRPAVIEVPLANPGLWALVRQLPARQRTAVTLRYIGDFPEADIAAAMGISRGTVARTLHDARIRLRHELIGDEPTDKEPIDG
jgi:DNA-directed RNA polymerase specialized sigma24 family protein